MLARNGHADKAMSLDDNELRCYESSLGDSGSGEERDFELVQWNFF